MTPAEALSILDQAASKYSGTRADHIAIQQAVQTLSEVIKPAPEIRPELEARDANVEEIETPYDPRFPKDAA